MEIEKDYEKNWVRLPLVFASNVRELGGYPVEDVYKRQKAGREYFLLRGRQLDPAEEGNRSVFQDPSEDHVYF